RHFSGKLTLFAKPTLLPTSFNLSQSTLMKTLLASPASIPMLTFLRITTLTLFLTPVATFAQPASDPPATPHQTLHALLEHPTVLLVDIDLTKVNIEALLDWTVEVSLLDASARPPAHLLQMASGFIQSLKSAGAEH